MTSKMLSPSRAPDSDWYDHASLTVVVQKRDTDQMRLCVNYKRLNAATVFDPEPMPETEVILVKLAGCKYFTALIVAKVTMQ